MQTLMKKWIGAACSIFLLQACAFSNETVKLSYSNAEPPRGALTEQQALRFQVAEFKDARSDTKRVGRRRNSLMLDLADIYSDQPLGSVVQKAVQAELARNRQQVTDQKPDVVVRGEIKKFFVETTMAIFLGALVYSELDAEAEIYVETVDGGSGKVLYSQTYLGAEHFKTEPLQSQYEKVLNAALSKAISTIGMDRGLAMALPQRDRSKDLKSK